MDIYTYTDVNCSFKLLPSRPWRTYIGGKLLDEFHGVEGTSDEHFPEEWIMSIVSARNTGREKYKNEGLSILASSNNTLNITLKDLIDANGNILLGNMHVKKSGIQTGVLVKLIDSAERLTIQVHPNKDKARRLFNSKFGKTECWHIINGREINGLKPCIYLGFKKGITREYWEKIFSKQDIPCMLDCLHKFDVKAGEVFLMPLAQDASLLKFRNLLTTRFV